MAQKTIDEHKFYLENKCLWSRFKVLDYCDKSEVVDAAKASMTKQEREWYKRYREIKDG